MSPTTWDKIERIAVRVWWIVVAAFALGVLYTAIRTIAREWAGYP